MRNFLRNILIIFTLIAAGTTNTYANEIKYDYLEASYFTETNSTIGTDVDGGGFHLSGLFSVFSFIALNVTLGITNYDAFASAETKVTELSIGAVPHISLFPGTDLYGQASLVYNSLEANDEEFGYTVLSDRDSGSSISIGLRHMLTDIIEISAAATSTNIFDRTEDTAMFNARIYPGEKLSVGITVKSGDTADSVYFNTRVDF